MQEERKKPSLSAREQQLISLAAKGFTDVAISQQLGISEPTVKSYWGRVRSKLGPFNRTELVANALNEESDRANVALNKEIERLRVELAESDLKVLDLQKALDATTQDAVFAVDGTGNFLWLNPVAEKMFGYTLAEIQGAHVSLLIPPEHKNLEMDNLSRYFTVQEKKSELEHISSVGLRKSGELFPISATVAAINSPGGGILTCFVREAKSNEVFTEFAQESSSTFNES